MTTKEPYRCVRCGEAMGPESPRLRLAVVAGYHPAAVGWDARTALWSMDLCRGCRRLLTDFLARVPVVVPPPPPPPRPPRPPRGKRSRPSPAAPAPADL